MKIFVTGGAGFIGKHLVKKLIEEDLEITIFDNFSNAKKNDLNKFCNKIRIISGDITNYDVINKNLSGQDIVIHLAAKISVNDSIINPEKTFETNVHGTENVLKACITNNVKKFIAISSAAVYGDNINSKKLLNEKSDTNPISPYGESKFKMEEKIFNFSRKYKMKCIILRLFNVYGKGQSIEYAGVISKFGDNIKNNQHLTIYGEGTQMRDFVSVDDIVNLINSIIFSESEKDYVICNVGSGKSTSILELAELMIRLSKKELKIIHVEEKEGDIMSSSTDIEKAKKEFGYTPQISLIEGLTRYLTSNNL